MTLPQGAGAPLAAPELASPERGSMLSRFRGWARRRPAPAVALALFLFLFGLYALSAGGHTYSSDEEGFFQQARALLDGRANLDLTVDERGVTSLAGGRGGGVIAGGGIGMPIATAPLVAVGQIVGAFAPSGLSQVVERLFADFTNAWVTAALAVVLLLGCMTLGASRRDALLLALVFGVGTAAWPHAKTLFSEPLTALLVTAAVVVAIRAASGRGRLAALAAIAGLAACAALMVRISAAPFVPIIGVYLTLVTFRRAGLRSAGVAAGAFIAGALPALAVLALTNRWRGGDAVSTGYGAVPFNRGIFDGFANLYLSPGKSLFLYAPIALVALVAAPFAARRRAPEALLLLALIVANTVIFGRFQAWSGDHAWGPRYMHIVLPLFVLLLAPVVGRVPWRRAVLLAGILGVATASIGATVAFNQYITHVANRVQGPPVDGEPAYANALHHYPRWSPIIGQPRLIDDAVENSAADLDQSGESAARPSPFPTATGARYFWYFQPPRLDAWWLWVFPERLPRWLLLMAPLFLALTALGLRGMRRSLAPHAQAPDAAAHPARGRLRLSPAAVAPSVALSVVVVLAGSSVIAAAAIRAVGASSRASVALVTEGFGPGEPDGDAVAHWLEAPEGRLQIDAPAAAQPLAIRLTMASFARPRRVALSIDGRALGVVAVPASGYREVTVNLGRVSPGSHALVLRPNPGAQSIAATIGTADTRSVSIRLRDPTTVFEVAQSDRDAVGPMTEVLLWVLVIGLPLTLVAVLLEVAGVRLPGRRRR